MFYGIITVYIIIIVALLILNRRLFSSIGFSHKHIMLLFFGGMVLLLLLQKLYISIGEGFRLNLLFVEGNFQINDFINSVKDFTYKELDFFGEQSILYVFISLLIPAALEEFGKLYIFKKIAERYGLINKIQDAIYGIAIVAIGFALSETFYYIIFLHDTLSTLEIVKLFFNRLIISTISHMFFSCIFGYAYAKSLFMNYYFLDNFSLTQTTKILKFIKRIPFLNIRFISTICSFYFLMQGFILSVLVHAIYNTLMSSDNNLIANLLVILGIYIFYHIMNLPKNKIIYSSIQNKINDITALRTLRDRIKQQ